MIHSGAQRERTGSAQWRKHGGSTANHRYKIRAANRAKIEVEREGQ